MEKMTLNMVSYIAGKENRIYKRGIYYKKSVKRPFCCTVSIPQVYFTYLCYITFGTSFYRKSKINIERKPNY